MSIVQTIVSIGKNPITRIINIAVALILALLIALMNFWMFIAVIVSMFQTKGPADAFFLIEKETLITDSIAPVVLVPVFQYFIYFICIFSAIVSFLVAFVHAFLEIPVLADKIPKPLSTTLSSICSVVMVIISTIYMMAFLSEIGLTESLDRLPKNGGMRALVATQAAIIIAYLIFMAIYIVFTILSLFITAFKLLDLVHDDDVVPSGKNLRPYRNNEFISPTSQEYSLGNV